MTLTSLGCATLSACKAGFKVEVYGFDLVRSRLYLGKFDDPKKVVALDSTFPETEWVAVTLKDFLEVKRQCHVGQ